MSKGCFASFEMNGSSSFDLFNPVHRTSVFDARHMIEIIRI
ncbi:hypothetical protein N825_00720 [Skermanella stibiiresistens SB22]|uniref:Uncharacterized protein n=1 Tax=Skermanella stibiiresistens SB22 TaxID=1385369 RepID=W9H958_9PROT|nr:hypothetical protein N825_00720 [Skermanella stibiiresistens SB22]